MFLKFNCIHILDGTCLQKVPSCPKGAKVYPASRRRSSKRVGLEGQLAPQCAMIKKIYPGIQKAVHQFRFKNFEHLLGSGGGGGGDHNLRPSCSRPPARTFHTPIGTLRLDAPALVRVRSPNDWDEVNQVLCPHSRCFGSYFDVIFLMYLVSSGFSFKPTSSSSSSSSTQFSQE